jgi:hypothetical protein
MSQRIIDRSYVGEVLQHMYNSDFITSASLIFTGGYFYLELEGARIPLHGTTVEEAVTHLASHLTEKFPASKFANWWGNNFREYSEQ